MKCTEANAQLTALASGQLDADVERELRDHLESCEECLLEYEKLRKEPVSHESMTSEARLDVAPLAPPTSDWTVEKIFEDGAGSSASASPASAPAPAEAAPPAFGPPASVPPAPAPIIQPPPSGTSFHDVALPPTPPAPSPKPSLILPPPPDPATAATPEKAGKRGWDFEPADAAREATPPEESLLFAEQALNRRLDGSGRKNSGLRMLLWGGGAVVGVGLLGVSLWMAMENHGAEPREIAARVLPSAGASTTVTHSAPGGESTSAPEEAVPPAEPNSDPTNAAPGAPVATETPAPAPVPVKSSLSPALGAPSTAASKAGRSTETGTKSKAASKTRELAAEKATVAAPPPKLARDDDDMWPVDDPVHAAAPSPRVTPKPPSAPPATAAPGTAAPSGSDSAEIEKPAAPAADMKPIDRIHAATEQAAKDEDLASLRRLKDTWKNLTRTVVGPDRARAKREFADCLWYIQTLTGRDSDQREALAAYRDFLLSAPAGGADARSAARLRELEDALAERR